MIWRLKRNWLNWCRVRRCAPGANAATKELLEANKHLDDVAMIRYAGEISKSVKSDEGKEGVFLS